MPSTNAVRPSMWNTAPLRNTKTAYGCVYMRYNKFHTVCTPWHMYWGHWWHTLIQSPPNVVLISQLGGSETNMENSWVASGIPVVCFVAALWKARNKCLELVGFTEVWGEGVVNCVYRWTSKRHLNCGRPFSDIHPGCFATRDNSSQLQWCFIKKKYSSCI